MPFLTAELEVPTEQQITIAFLIPGLALRTLMDRFSLHTHMMIKIQDQLLNRVSL